MTSTSGPTAAYASLMLRLALQPSWVRFMGWAAYAAPWWLMISATWRNSVWSMAIVSVCSVALATYQGQAMQKALTAAVGGLHEIERSEAIATITRGVAPTDLGVWAAAIRLGRAYLGGQSTDQLKRQEQRTWILLAVVAAVFFVLALINSWGHATSAYLVLGLTLLVVLALEPLSRRRIQQNIALFAEGCDAR